MQGEHPVADDPSEGRIGGGRPGVDAGSPAESHDPRAGDWWRPAWSAAPVQLKSKEDQMSKTAREVMTPRDARIGEADAGRVLGGRPPGSAGGPGQPHAIGADDWVDHALVTMSELKVRRLPVIDRGRLVGMVSQGDLASSIEHPETWSFLCS